MRQMPQRCSICSTFMKAGMSGELRCQLCDFPNMRSFATNVIQNRHISLRCRVCDECYPVADEWKACANCMDEPTFPSINEPTLTQDDAVSRSNHAAFGRWLYERDCAAHAERK